MANGWPRSNCGMDPYRRSYTPPEDYRDVQLALWHVSALSFFAA
jgi:hypothetical protein